MNELALFAGAGGGILGGKLLGWRTVCAVEWDAYAASVLVARQNDGSLEPFPVWDDVTTFDGNPWRGIVEVVSGGFPCQDISVAGKGAGIDGERSGMWKHMARIVSEVRPQHVFVENSPMLIVRGLGRVLGDLAEMGYDSRWGVLGGKSIGLCCSGERLWIVAHASNRIRRTSPPIQSKSTGQEKSSRRQFERAISACASSETHAARLRDIDGLARDMDRLKAIGNGQVPGVAELAWETLKP